MVECKSSTAMELEFEVEMQTGLEIEAVKFELYPNGWMNTTPIKDFNRNIIAILSQLMYFAI